MKRRPIPALASIFLSACASARAADCTTVERTFHYGFAQEVLEIVNIERTERGGPLVMTPALTDAAMKRAAELAVHWVQVFSGGTGSADTRSGDRDVVVNVGTASGRDSVVRNYAIAFEANGGTGSAAVLKALYGTSVRLPDNPFRRTGYQFLGWATARSGAVRYANGASVKNLRTDGGTTTLCAVWKKRR